MNPRALLTAALVAPALLSGCKSAPPVCADPTRSDVRFLFDRVLAQHRDKDLSVKACVEDTCESAQSVPRASPVLSVESSELTSGPVHVTLTITAANGEVLVDDRTTVKPRRHVTDDPGCEGATWNAGAVVTKDGKLQNEYFRFQ